MSQINAQRSIGSMKESREPKCTEKTWYKRSLQKSSIEQKIHERSNLAQFTFSNVDIGMKDKITGDLSYTTSSKYDAVIEYGLGDQVISRQMTSDIHDNSVESRL